MLPLPGNVGGILQAETIIERAYAALQNERVRERWYAAGYIPADPNVTAGDVLRFVVTTGLDPRLLFGRVHDSLSGMDDLPWVDTNHVR